MRTNVQRVKRYFIAVWSVYASAVILTTVAGASVEEGTLDTGLAIGQAILAVVSGVIGFVHGATAMHAKNVDDREAQENHDG